MGIEWLIGYLGTIAGILTIGEYLDRWMDADFKTQLARALKGGVAGNPSSWLLTISDAFVLLFDRLYGNKGTTKEEVVWAWLVGSLLAILWTRSRHQFILGTPDQPPVFLIATSSLVLLCALFRVAVKARFGERYLRLQTRLTLVGIAFGSLCLPTTLLLANGTLRLASTNPLSSVASSLLFLLGASSILLITLFAPVQLVPVDPFKAIISSALFITLIGFVVAGWIKTDLFPAFLEAVRLKVSHLGFVAFNVYSDGFSLLETRWVLRRGANSRATTLLVLLVLDVILSAAIFLFLPIALGGLEIMREAVFFHGTRPWLGVLFWSTFSTSLVFYLYVVAALAVKPLAWFAKLLGIVARPFDPDSHPVRAIAIAMALCATPVFLVGAAW